MAGLQSLLAENLVAGFVLSDGRVRNRFLNPILNLDLAPGTSIHLIFLAGVSTSLRLSPRFSLDLCPILCVKLFNQVPIAHFNFLLIVVIFEHELLPRQINSFLVLIIVNNLELTEVLKVLKHFSHIPHFILVPVYVNCCADQLSRKRLGYRLTCQNLSIHFISHFQNYVSAV